MLFEAFELVDKNSNLVPITDEVFIHPLKLKVLDLMDEYYDRNGERPTDVYFTFDDELAMSTFDQTDIGNEHITTLITEGPREAFDKFLGMLTHWQNDRTRVTGRTAD